jgi:hypothetical protein
METAMRALSMCVFVLLLAGCATQSERAAQVERDVDDMIRVYGPGCEKLGYKGDSDQWRDCVVKLATKDNLERYSRDYSVSCIGHRGFFQCSRF